MSRQSAGILLYRRRQEREFFLVHPGGPFFRKKQAGWWTIPKGEPGEGEDLLAAAIRELEEETGHRSQGPYLSLGTIQQKGGKQVSCWACEGDLDAEAFTCNTFTIEWPPRSGRQATFPEIDQAGWFSFEKALELINAEQAAFLHELSARLDNDMQGRGSAVDTLPS